MLLSCIFTKFYRDRIMDDPKLKIKTLKDICKRELRVYANFNIS